ncbi:MAG: glutamate--tRNA ligase [Ectothiorhodospira sp.]
MPEEADIAMKTRFAPSPTGHLHLGNLRTALFNALAARGREGTFLLRIEDTDAERSRDEYTRDLMEDLRWLGLDWQEGPEVGGGAGPYLQSQRGEVYATYFHSLEERGLVYPCFCSDQSLRLARRAQMAAGQPPRYPGTCARLTPEEVQARLARGERPTLRFRVPRGRTVVFEDRVRGPQRFATEDIGDFIIRRSDGTPSFFFSNALDDALMGVTLVLRGEDHIANTPRQLLLLEALGLTPPAYGHISLILDEDGGPLSKRSGALSLRRLRDQGYLPLALLNHLARLGHIYDDDGLMDRDTLAARFDIARLGRAPARHDGVQLDHWQRLAVAEAPDAVLENWLAPDAPVPAGQGGALVAAVRDNILFPEDLNAWARRLFAPELPLEAAQRSGLREAGGAFFDAALEVLAEDPAEFPAFAKAVGRAAGRKGKALYMPLRLALTGVPHGPEMHRVWDLLGPERVRRRLEQARDLAAA